MGRGYGIGGVRGGRHRKETGEGEKEIDAKKWRK